MGPVVDGMGVRVGVHAGVGIRVGEDVEVGVSVAVAVPVGLGVFVSVGVAVGVRVGVHVGVGDRNASPLTLDANVSLGNDRVESSANPPRANIRRMRPRERSIRVRICPSFPRWENFG